MKQSHRKRIVLAAALTTLGLTHLTQGASVTWLGTTSGDWGTASNWSSNAVPTSADDVFFYAPGASFLDVALSAEQTIRTLTFTSDATTQAIITSGAVNSDPLLSRRLTINGVAGADDVIVTTGSHILRGIDPVSPNQELRIGSISFNIATGAQLELNARLQAANSGNLYRKLGGGTLLITGANGGGSGWNFSNTTGGFIIDEGVLVLASSSAFGNSSNRWTVNNGGVFQIQGNYGSNNGGVQSWNDGGIIRTTVNDVAFTNGTGSVLLTGTPIIEVLDHTFTISQDMGGSGNLFKRGAGTLVIDGGNSYTGSTIVSEGTLVLGAGANINSSPRIDVQTGGTLDVTPLGAFTVAANQTLTGRGTIVGNVSLSDPNSTLAPGGVQAAGTTTIANDLNLSGGTLRVDLANVTTVGADVNDIVNVGGALNLSGSTNVAIKRTNGSLATGTYTIMSYAGALSGTAANLLTPTVRQGLSIDLTTANQVNLVVGSGTAMNLTWSGDGSLNNWDLNTTSNFNGNTQKFFDWDTVTFDNTGSDTPSVNVNGVLQPDVINLANTSLKTYNFVGGGSLINVLNVNKTGAGVATFSNTGSNQFDALTMSAGSLALANNTSVSSLTVNGGVLHIAPGFSGLIGAGVVNTGGQVLVTSNGTFSALTVASGGTLNVGDGLGANAAVFGNITTNGRTRLNRTDDHTVDALFSGSGVIEKLGNGTATLAGNNSGFTGEILATSGGLRVTSSNSLGSTTSGTVTLVSGTTLDIASVGTNALNFGTRVFKVEGAGIGDQGVITNTANNQQNVFQQVVLTNNATFAGSARYDIRGGTPMLDLAGFTLTKKGNNQFTLVGVNVTDGSIVVNEGTFAIETTTTLAGNGSVNLAGADTRLSFFNTQGTLSVTRPVFVNGTGIQIGNASATASFVSSPITLANDVTFKQFGSTGGLNLFGNITETGGPRSITKDDTLTLALGGNNSYTGTTTVTAGTLRVNGTHTGGAAYSIGGGATFGGTGTVTAQVNMAGGSNLAPGASVGVLTVGSLALDSTSLQYELDATGADRVNVVSSGGLSLIGTSTFTLSDLGGIIAGTYTLIDYAGSALTDLSNFSLATTSLGIFNFALVNNTANTSVDLSVTSTAVVSAWNVDSDGNWSVGSNWSAGVPNSVDATANFGTVITAPRTVTVDSAQTLGTMNFSSPNSYTVAGAAALTMDVSSGQAAINVTAGSHVVSAPVTLNDDLTITADTGTGVALSGDLTATGRTITKAGAGTAQFANVRSAGLNVSAGSARISAKGTANDPAGTSVVNSLSIASGASLDLTNNSMVIDFSGSVGTLVNDTRLNLQAGRLTSSSADATKGLGYGDNAILGKTSFAGQTVDASSVLVKYTYFGDTNLDGQVDITDLGNLATAWQTSGAWTSGDSDYSGFIDITDLGALATNWQAGVGSPLGPSFGEALAAVGLGGVSVPEPAVLGLAAFGLAKLLTRRRRR